MLEGNKKATAPSGPEGESSSSAVGEGVVDSRKKEVEASKYVKFCVQVLAGVVLLLLGIFFGVALTLAQDSAKSSSTFPPVTSAPNLPKDTTSQPTVSPTSSPTKSSCDQVELYTEIRNDEEYIGIVFVDCPTKEVYDAFIKAARRWSEVIISSRVTPSYLPTSDLCSLDSDFVFDNNGIPTDHLTIYASVSNRNMYNGDVAYTGFCVFDFSVKFPILGYLVLSLEDLPSLINDDTLETVVLHEMAHVLGFGISWPFMTQDGKDGLNVLQPNHEALIQDEVFQMMFDTTGEFVGMVAEPTNKPHFTGVRAVEKYISLGGNPVNAVPVEDGSGIFDTELWEGLGVVDAHWSHSIFEDELMVFKFDPSIKYKLSEITIASLEDLGYHVDYSKADLYSVPKKNLRRSDPVTKEKQSLFLKRDALRPSRIGIGLPAT